MTGRTQIHHELIAPDTITGDEIKEESLIVSKIPFSADGFGSLNLRDAVIEAKEGKNNYKEVALYGEEKSSSSEAYTNYFTFTSNNNGQGKHLICIGFMFAVSNKLKALKYRVKINGQEIEEKRRYAANANDNPTNEFIYEVDLTDVQELTVELDFAVEQSFWGFATGKIVKAYLIKQLKDV